jgi:hypothetical protein
MRLEWKCRLQQQMPFMNLQIAEMDAAFAPQQRHMLPQDLSAGHVQA